MAAKLKKTTSSSGNMVNYGTGVYGGKYMGSNTSSMYSNANMENAPSSTGYEKGTVTLQKKDDNGNVISQRTVEGVLPLGTSFKATGSALADAKNAPDSSGVFAYAKGRTPGYVEHVSGYSGYGYQDAKGNFYDANGNYLREDGHFYEPGASISKNGRYQDTGSGMGNARYGVTYIPGAGTMYTQQANPYYGAAPNSVLEIIDAAHGWGGGSSGSNSLAAGNNASKPTTSTPTVEEEVESILNGTFLNNYSQYNNSASLRDDVVEELRKLYEQSAKKRDY